MISSSWPPAYPDSFQPVRLWQDLAFRRAKQHYDPKINSLSIIQQFKALSSSNPGQVNLVSFLPQIFKEQSGLLLFDFVQ
jgi:hypothetical protein